MNKNFVFVHPACELWDGHVSNRGVRIYVHSISREIEIHRSRRSIDRAKVPMNFYASAAIYLPCIINQLGLLHIDPEKKDNSETNLFLFTILNYAGEKFYLIFSAHVREWLSRFSPLFYQFCENDLQHKIGQ